MTKDELREAILKAAEIIGQKEVLVFGSQAILASYEFRELPSATTMSAEADIAPSRDIADHLSQKLWMEAGQGSDWALERDYYIDAVSADTSVLPARWRERAVVLSWPAHPGITAVCPDSYDLCASKLARNEEKDRTFVVALIEAGLIRPRLLRNRFDEISDERLEPARKRVAKSWIIHQERTTIAAQAAGSSESENLG
jgi:hypothetical protein